MEKSVSGRELEVTELSATGAIVRLPVSGGPRNAGCERDKGRSPLAKSDAQLRGPEERRLKVLNAFRSHKDGRVNAHPRDSA